MKNKDKIPEKQDLEEFEETETPKFYRVFIIVTSVLIILLVLSISILQFPIGEIIHGLIKSDQLVDNKIISNNYIIRFDDNIVDIIKSIYYNKQEIETVESVLCLQGSVRGREYYINKVIYPQIIDQYFNKVKYKRCSSETLVLFHTHPRKFCIASEEDMKNLNEFQKNNNKTIMLIMCDNNRISVYN